MAEHAGPRDLVVIGADLCENPSQRGYDHLITKFKVLDRVLLMLFLLFIEAQVLKFT